MGDVSASGVQTVSTNIVEPAPAQPAPTGEPPTGEPPAEPPATPPATVDTKQFGDWRDQMHEDIRGNDAFKDMKGPDELAHAYLDRMDGYHRTPGGEATDEEVEKFYEDIGVPKEFEDYEKGIGELKIPESIEADKEFMDEALNQAFEMHMFPFQIEGMLQWYYGRLAETQEQINADELKQSDDALQQLKRDWGANYRTNTAIVDKALTALGGDELLDWAESVGVANDVTFLRMMHSIGKNLTEDMVLQGVPVKGGTAPPKQTHLQYAKTPEHGAY